MSMPAITAPSPATKDPRRAHRWLCVVAGGLSAAGAVLGWVVHPALLGLAVLGGLALLLAPDRTRRPAGEQP